MLALALILAMASLGTTQQPPRGQVVSHPEYPRHKLYVPNPKEIITISGKKRTRRRSPNGRPGTKCSTSLPESEWPRKSAVR